MTSNAPTASLATFCAYIHIYLIHYTPHTEAYWSRVFRLSHLCPEDIFWTNKLCATKLFMMVYHHDLECHAKRLGSYIHGQGNSAVKSSKSKSLSYLLNLFTFCNQIGHSGADHEPGCCVTVLDCYPGHSEGSSPPGIFVRMISSEPLDLTFNETWYVGESSWPGVSCKQFGFLPSR